MGGGGPPGKRRLSRCGGRGGAQALGRELRDLAACRVGGGGDAGERAKAVGEAVIAAIDHLAAGPLQTIGEHIALDDPRIEPGGGDERRGKTA